MKVTKYFRPKNATGTFDEEIYYAVDSHNVDCEDGQNLKDKLTSFNSRITANEDDLANIDEVKSNVESNTKNIQRVDGKADDINKELGTTKQDLGNLTDRVNTAEGNITDLQEDVTKMGDTISTTVNTALETVCYLSSSKLTCTLPEDL